MSKLTSIEENIEIKRRLWNGSISLKIIISIVGESSEDGITNEYEYLTEGYRNAYLPTLYPNIVSYIKKLPTVAFSNNSPIWLEYEGVPLRWNLPIGVLYDHLYLPAKFTNQSTPWTLDLKIASSTLPYPSNYIVPFTYSAEDGSVNYTKSINEMLLNQLKQSCYVLNGTAKPIMQLNGPETESLCNSVITRNLKTYNFFNNKIIKQIRGIPVRIYLPNTQLVAQAAVDPHILLQDLLLERIPTLMEVSVPIIHGIDAGPLLKFQLNDIWHQFKHPDNVLYISILMP
ncbi:autophagy protein 5 [Lodderomyces elongisporus]|uniref:autophagy protein 5 n=1 Tax=Lodderomyces elongisporus TaxID=36914 RepID=UPI00292084B7|nr:autophagy protein 5 [Lodderomyces elongisporus]WLF77892.1 autophagy protein 5 [Lodderomyces elongisporus]